MKTVRSKKAASKAAEPEQQTEPGVDAAWQAIHDATALDLTYWAFQRAQEEWQASGNKKLEAAARILHALSIALEDEQDAGPFKTPNDWAAGYLRARLEGRGEHVTAAHPHGTLDRSVDGRLDKKAQAARAFVDELTSIVAFDPKDKTQLSKWERLPKTVRIALWFDKRMATPLGAKLYAPIAPDAAEAMYRSLETLQVNGKLEDVEEVFVQCLHACGMPMKAARNLAAPAFGN